LVNLDKSKEKIYYSIKNNKMINNNRNCINIKNSQIGINIEENTFENNIETPIII